MTNPIITPVERNVADLAARRLAVQAVRLHKPVTADAVLDAIQAYALFVRKPEIATNLTGQAPIVHAVHDLLPAHQAAVVAHDEHTRALRAERLPQLLAAWTVADRSRQIRALTNNGPRTIATVEAFVVTAETGRASTPAPQMVITDRYDPRIPNWSADVVGRLSVLTEAQVEAALGWMDPDIMQHTIVDLSHDGPVERVVARFTTPNDAAAWLEQAPAGYRVLFSDVRDLRAFPSPAVWVHVSIAPEASPV